MNQEPKYCQTDKSLNKNTSFFKDNIYSYNKNIQELDTYCTIRKHLNEALQGIDHLLDIGNGGVFDYDTNILKTIVALDLFLEDLPTSFSYPSNVTLKSGNSLNISEPDESFDGVLISMLFHHLTGKTIGESLENIKLAAKEALRVLRPGGKLIVIESCVPKWFYFFEKAVSPFMARLINATLSHPATLQFPAAVIEEILEELDSSSIEANLIPKGRWIL